MTGADWQDLEARFHEALELSPPERGRFLSGLDPGTRAQLEGLLREAGEHTLSDSIAGAISAMAGVALDPGGRAGSYRLIRCLGEGGMGSVYLAERDDDAFEKRVAVKFVRTGLDSPALRQRFEVERRILAVLDHPSIARLIDAGATKQGIPYFVMEYVDSAGNLVEYATREQLSVDKRLRLLLQVCDAVQYAHRNLIVHRDLKPGNILVNREGVPKLLDFGVAKLLDDAAADQPESTHMRWATPKFSSPEQLRGDPVSTASDVYSLGMIVRELLPGTAADGDLELIAGKATRADAAERYGSPAALAQDLSAFLEHRPISVRGYSAWERAVRLARRNRTASLATAASVVFLLGGSGMALRSARIAEAARAEAVREQRRAESEAARADRQAAVADERSVEARRQTQLAVEREQEALAARALADRRYKESGDLASGFIHDVYTEISALTGATKARTALLTRIVAYLENLSAQKPSDEAIQLDLAAAYRETAILEGSAGDARTASVPQALARLQRSREILTRLVAKHPRRADLSLRLAETNRSYIEIEVKRASDPGSLRKASLENIESIRRLEQASPNHAGIRLVLATALNTYVNAGLRNQHWLDIERDREAQGLLRGLIADRGAAEIGFDVREALGDSLSFEGQIHQRQERWPDALRAFRESLAIRQALLAEQPFNPILKRNLMLSYGFVLNTHSLAGSGTEQEAASAGAKMVAIAKELASADSTSVGAKYDYAMSGLRYAGLLAAAGDHEGAATREAASIATLTELRTARPGYLSYETQLLNARRQYGDTLRALGKADQARRMFEAMAAEAVRVAVKSPPATQLGAYAYARIALLKCEAGEDGTAEAEKALKLSRSASGSTPRTKDSESADSARIGEVYALMAKRTGNTEHWRRAAELLAPWVDQNGSRTPTSPVREGERWQPLLERARSEIEKGR